LEGAPGWRVIEHPRRRSWRAGYVVVPVVLVVGLIEAFLLWDRDSIGWGWADDLRQGLSESHAPSTARDTPGDPASRAPALASQPHLEDRIVQSPAREGSPLQDTKRSELSGDGSADETSSVEPRSGPGTAPIRISIYHTAGADNALRAIQLAAFLKTHGFDIVDIRAVEFDIEQPSVGYFFNRDQPESQRLVEAVDTFFAKTPARAPEKASGFISLASKPPPGNVEVWLPGQRDGEHRPS
jgi:hypothetical protein